MANPFERNLPEMPENNAQERVENSSNKVPCFITFMKMNAAHHNSIFLTHNDKPLRKLKESYCYIYGVCFDAVTFKFNGRTVRDVDTCASLGIENRAIIKVVDNAQYIPRIELPNENSTDRIVIRIFRWDNNSTYICRTLRSIPIFQILQHHSQLRFNITCAQRFSYRGRVIQENDTPASLRMQNMDLIDIFYAQEGGGCSF